MPLPFCLETGDTLIHTFAILKLPQHLGSDIELETAIFSEMAKPTCRSRAASHPSRMLL